MHVPVDEEASALDLLGGIRLVGHDDVGLRLAGHGGVVAVGGGLLLGRRVGVVVAEPARVVEAGDAQSVEGHLAQRPGGVLEEHDVGDAREPSQDRPVARRGLVVVAAREDVGHPERLDRAVEPGGVALLDPAEVDEVAAVDDRVDVLLLDDRSHQGVLVRPVDVRDEQEAGRGGLVDVAGDVLLLECLRHGEEVAEVGGHLRGPSLDVGQQAGVALDDTEDAARAVLREAVRLVGQGDPTEGDAGRDDHGRRDEEHVVTARGALSHVVGGQGEQHRDGRRAEEEADADAGRGLRDRRRDLVG